MSDLLKLIQEADVVALEMERARSSVENSKQALEKAKENFEMARKSFDEVLVKADELGVPRPKVRKLIEERTSALVASGLIGDSATSSPAKVAKTPKAPKASRKKAASEEIDFDEALEQDSASLEMV